VDGKSQPALQPREGAGANQGESAVSAGENRSAVSAELSRRAADKLRAQGNHVELYEIDGTNGHLDGLFSIGKVADQIRAFMEK